MNTIFAKKIGRAGKYPPDRARVGVTTLRVFPTTVVGLRTKDKHGYEAVVVKSQVTSHKSQLREIRTGEKMEPGTGIKLEEVLKVGDVVRVAGVRQGKGFAGVVKRHGFAGGPRTHGQSDRHRAPGSIGAGTTPGRVLKGTRMAGHMGDERVTSRNLGVVRADPERNLIFGRGAVPGPRSGLVLVHRAKYQRK